MAKGFTLRITKSFTKAMVARQAAQGPKNHALRVGLAKKHQMKYRKRVEDYYLELLGLLRGVADFRVSGASRWERGLPTSISTHRGNNVKLPSTIPHAKWKPLSSNYLRRKRLKSGNSDFMDYSGDLREAIRDWFKPPSRNAIRSNRIGRITPTSGVKFSANMSVSIVHDLPDPNLSAYIHTAFITGKDPDKKLLGSARGLDMLKLVMFETGLRGKRKGIRSTTRPIFGAIARTVGLSKIRAFEVRR